MTEGAPKARFTLEQELIAAYAGQQVEIGRFKFTVAQVVEKEKEYCFADEDKRTDPADRALYIGSLIPSEVLSLEHRQALQVLEEQKLARDAANGR